MLITAGSFEVDNGRGDGGSDENDDMEEALGVDLEEEEEDEESFDYVVGFVGHKLGYEPVEEEKPGSWISVVGEGKLHQPRQNLIEMCRNCND